MIDQSSHPRGRTAAAKSIRGAYERDGVTPYYQQAGGEYENPHEPVIALLLDRIAPAWQLDLTHVLDLAAGSGEVTLALRRLGAVRVDGMDPFTADAYARRTGSTAEPFDFAAIAAGQLAGRRYSLIACSFALHLCESLRLPAVAQQLSHLAPSLLIVTPHKRPNIECEWGWELKEETVMSRVRARLYRSTFVRA